MENLQKRINVRLVNKAEIFLKYTSKPNTLLIKCLVLIKIMLLFMKLNQC